MAVYMCAMPFVAIILFCLKQYNMQVVTLLMRVALMNQGLCPSGGADLRTGTWLRQQLLMVMGHLQMAPTS